MGNAESVGQFLEAFPLPVGFGEQLADGVRDGESVVAIFREGSPDNLRDGVPRLVDPIRAAPATPRPKRGDLYDGGDPASLVVDSILVVHDRSAFFGSAVLPVFHHRQDFLVYTPDPRPIEGSGE